MNADSADNHDADEDFLNQQENNITPAPILPSTVPDTIKITTLSSQDEEEEESEVDLETVKQTLAADTRLTEGRPNINKLFFLRPLK